MTKKLEDLFGLPSAKTVHIPDIDEDDDDDDEEPEDQVVSRAITTANNNLAHIEAALPAVKELALIDEELDEIAKKAMESFEDLSDLGMNVDSRFASEIFSVASSMMGHALSAKTAKASRKMKTIELQMKKLRLELDMKKQSAVKTTANTSSTVADVIEDAEGRVLSRNELMDMLKRDGDSSEN